MGKKRVYTASRYETSDQEDDEQEEEEEVGQEASSTAWKRARTDTYGFKPMEEEAPPPQQTQIASGDQEKAKKLRLQLNTLVLRYPTLQLRNSEGLLKKLENVTLAELENMHMNAVADMLTIRGTPTAKTALLAVKPVDYYLPNYYDHCAKDEELKRDIEAEMIEQFGFFGNKINILLGLARNGFSTWEDNEKARLSGGFNYGGPATMPQEGNPIAGAPSFEAPTLAYAMPTTGPGFAPPQEVSSATLAGHSLAESSSDISTKSRSKYARPVQH